MNLQIVYTEPQSAKKNMKKDEDLLASLEKRAILHFYQWESLSATYGYFSHPERFLDLSVCERKNISLARRPTGGGIVFHMWDLAFSFLMPASHPLFSENTLDNYRFVNAIVLESVQELIQKKEIELIEESSPELSSKASHFCMARPTKYDVVLRGKKIAGAAQRQTKKGYLHQGTISLALPSRELLKEVLLPSSSLLEAFFSVTYAPLEMCSEEKLEEGREMMKKILQRQFERFLF